MHKLRMKFADKADALFANVDRSSSAPDARAGKTSFTKRAFERSNEAFDVTLNVIEVDAASFRHPTERRLPYRRQGLRYGTVDEHP